ncbi:hypothetical protein ACFV2X_42890 [Streptomyces sp. NPDC059679]|uniref:hypothetical protein n=1 Tax=Streptomyces sp. NPDC059679 TaxID=3346903 RepID=UPI00368F300E
MRHSIHDDDQPMRPWGIVTADFWAAGQDAARSTEGKAAAQAEPQHPLTAERPAPPPPPEEYGERIAAITAAFNDPEDQALLASAGVDAEKLDEEITARFGSAHTHTINVRELRGWIAYLMGQSAVAARWYLHTTGLQTAAWGPDHSITQGSAQRAAHTWRSITDRTEAIALGPELVAMLAVVTGEDSQASQQVRARLDRMGAKRQ